MTLNLNGIRRFLRFHPNRRLRSHKPSKLQHLSPKIAGFVLKRHFATSKSPHSSSKIAGFVVKWRRHTKPRNRHVRRQKSSNGVFHSQTTEIARLTTKAIVKKSPYSSSHKPSESPPFVVRNRRIRCHTNPRNRRVRHQKSSRLRFRNRRHRNPRNQGPGLRV